MVSPHKKPLKITRTNRAKVDPKSGRVISRRAFDKKYPPQARHIKQAGYSSARYRHKLRLYKLIRDDFIEKKKTEGIILGKRAAMNSDELKSIIRGLHSKDPIKKALALQKTGRISPDQVEFYAQKFSDEGDE